MDARARRKFPKKRKEETAGPGQGRGLGTYSIKLLTERYLKGKVDFTSDATAGTTFRVWYPAAL